ncbi:MAG: F0F1 ATP synthase subunit B [Patescibacteria group bacterium]
MFIEIVHAATEATSEVEAATGPIGTLGINLKLFIAQLINFSVILLVLWRWAYRPLLRVLHERQKTIQDSVDNAKKIETRLGQAEQEYQEKMKQARRDATAVIAQTETEAREYAATMKKKTEEDLQKLAHTAQAKIVEEKEAAVREVQSHAAELITSAIKKVLGETMNIAEQEKVVRDFLKQEKG